MAIAFVKNVGSHTGNATTRQVTVPAAGVAAGNILLCRVSISSPDTVDSMTDTGGNTYSVIQGPTDSSAVRSYTYIATIVTPLVSGNTIDVTLSAKQNGPFIVDEFSGVTTTQDTSIEATGSSTTPSSGAISQTAAACLLFAHLGINKSSTSPVTEDADTDGGDTWNTLTYLAGSSYASHGAYKITTSAVSQTYNPTLSSTYAWVDYLVALAPPASAAVPRYGFVNYQDPGML